MFGRFATSHGSQRACHDSQFNTDWEPVNLADIAPNMLVHGHALRKSTLDTDRRRRSRLSLRWTARLLTAEHGWIEASIHNISSDGFYCVSESEFAAGANTLCVIIGPAHTPYKSCNFISIECKIKVVYSAPAGPKGVFGTGCQIQDYRFFSGLQ